MKSIFFAIAILLGAFIGLATNKIEHSQPDRASVNQVSGLYVFIESKPLADFEVLGTVKKTGLVWNGKAKEMQGILIRRALDDYPTAQGIIFDDISMDHATVIKFK